MWGMEIVVSDIEQAQRDTLEARTEKGELIWHYTNAGALESILKDKVIRLSHSAFLNDSTEMRYGRKVTARPGGDGRRPLFGQALCGVLRTGRP